MTTRFSSPSSKIAEFELQAPSGTDGGPAVVAGWNDRKLTTEIKNEIGATLDLTSGGVTIGAGRVEIFGSASTNNVRRTLLIMKLDGVEISRGLSIYSGGNSTDLTCYFSGHLDGGEITMHQYSERSVNTFDLGVAASVGGPEIYARLHIKK